MDIPKQIRMIRAGIGMSQEEIAKDLGVSTTTYINYEKGKTDIKAKHYVRMLRLSGFANPFFSAQPITTPPPKAGG